MQILKIIFIILEVVILFNVLIFVHELGHFLAARWRGLKVERFAIWFGKPIWKINYNGVEYVLGCIPAGGYVSLPQMAPMEAIEGKSDGPREELPTVSALDKIIVAFAGPLFSFGLAIAFAVMVSIVGRPVSDSEKTTVIGYVATNSPAEKAGLLIGDKILSVDNEPVSKFGGMGDSVTWRIVRSEKATIPITVQRGTETVKMEATPIKQETKWWQRKSLRQIMIEPAHTPTISKLATNSPALRAGLKPGDALVEVNGTKLYHVSQFVDYIHNHRGEKLNLTIARDGQTLVVPVQPEVPISPPKAKPLIGITEWTLGGKMELVYPGVMEQIRGGVDAMISTFGALFSRKSDISAQHLSGAVKIMNIYYLLFESEQGWRLALWFSVIMNVNLAILNLLPIPVLDGGHITLAIVESIRRKPVSVRLLGMLQTACAVLLIGYMLYIAFFDVQELGWGRGKSKAQPELRFAPPGETAPEPATP